MSLYLDDFWAACEVGIFLSVPISEFACLKIVLLLLLLLLPRLSGRQPRGWVDDCADSTATSHQLWPDPDGDQTACKWRVQWRESSVRTPAHRGSRQPITVAAQSRLRVDGAASRIWNPGRGTHCKSGFGSFFYHLRCITVELRTSDKLELGRLG